MPSLERLCGPRRSLAFAIGRQFVYVFNQARLLFFALFALYVQRRFNLSSKQGSLDSTSTGSPQSSLGKHSRSRI